MVRTALSHLLAWLQTDEDWSTQLAEARERRHRMYLQIYGCA